MELLLVLSIVGLGLLAFDLLADRFAHDRFFLYLGRHLGLPICQEGALKLKEISYIPTDAYAAGEMKHGPIALLGEDERRALLDQRAEARARKDFAAADAIRDGLDAMGIKVEDTFAEAFDVAGTAIIVTNDTPKWAMIAATVTLGLQALMPHAHSAG